MSTARRMRSTTVTLGVTALVAASLSACGSSEADNQAICVDPETQVRVDDDQCDDDADYYAGGGGFYWFYIPSGRFAPGIGSRYSTSGGTFDRSRLNGTVRKGGVDAGGGTVKRGGFGGSFKSGS